MPYGEGKEFPDIDAYIEHGLSLGKKKPKRLYPRDVKDSQNLLELIEFEPTADLTHAAQEPAEVVD